MDWYTGVWRPLLFRLSADRAHDLVQLGLRSRSVGRLLGRGSRFEDPRLATDLAGIELPNPIGLAPGFDKDGRLVSSLDELGFAYLVVGSITTEPRRGNPKPRLVRYPESLSIGNSMGLPSRGLAEAVRALAGLGETRTRVLASVAGFTSEELVAAAAAVEPHVAAVEIGLICPNTTESERMEELAIFTRLAEALAARKTKPVFVKLPPHHDEVARRQIFRMLDVCIETGIEGVSVSGGRTVAEPRLARGEGSLNGRLTHDDALRITRDVADHAAGRLAIKASGGVFHGRDAAAMLSAGATTVEVYSSLVYRGWATAGHLKRELLEILEERGLPGVAGLRPAAREGSRAEE